MALACVPSRCGLCGFEFECADWMVVSRLHSPHLSAICLLTYVYVVKDDGQQSRVMYHAILWSNIQDAIFKPCRWKCSHSGGRAKGCHAKCANQVPSTSLAVLLKALAYQHEPLPFEIARRIRWICLQYASRAPVLKHAKPHLPQELRFQIARHLLQGPTLHRYAAECTQTLLKYQGSGSSRICLSAEIWARFIHFEGGRYISSLRNSRDDDHTESIFTPDLTQSIDSVFIAENYLGVTKILFCSSFQAPSIKARDGLWWRVIRLCDHDQTLITQTDGFKLRTIALDNEETESRANHPLWSVPALGPVRSVQLGIGPPPAKLSMLVCNEPDVIAYSAFWTVGIMSLHAHTTGGDLAPYNRHEEGIWLYFPLEKGEKISEIWNLSQFLEGSALIFKTTHGRLAIFGPRFIPRTKPLPQSTLLDLPHQERGSRIFYEHSPRMVFHLAFETAKPVPPSRSITLNQPLSQNPISSLSKPYFYSAASLDCVDTIVPCQRYIDGRRHIIGLLLKFPEGRQSCVGQIRLDSLGNPIQAYSIQNLWIGFSLYRRRLFVSALTLSEPNLTEGLSWLKVQLHGTLEWWFSSTQCQLHHMGKSSPEPRHYSCRGGGDSGNLSGSDD
ncbi:hypothetical protein CH63R_12373 [Colletotrichum higginsianum IMI 349063]|uniref:Uncharacterized protein n=1 Tax=Colletotrichum higginsianum (strain IMI 349063) TaxID=759273 RepID=A0A1B7XU15_COLHI|nr:hypothetical protein CH63R_12373 [Colletotrichum higginsianum IMI 349063]OBR03246.1 hypothetical protein CH63R_12373 [Colletotrichum higginsianum IMI 349063]